MDISNPAVFVNAGLQRAYMGQRVRTVIQIIRSNGGVVIGKSSDDQQIVIKGQLLAPPTFVEVIGIADSHRSVLK